MNQARPFGEDAGRRDEDPAIHAQLSTLREQQERLFEQMQSGQVRFKQLARSVWRVQEDERRRLARELHDGIGQNLTALKHQLDAVALQVQGTPDLHQRVQGALALCASTLEDTRALSRLLRPQILDDLGLEAALRWLARSVAEGAGFQAEVDVVDLPEPLDPELSTLCFRVAQEGITNAARHAKARHVLIRLSGREHALQLLIADDGVGCDPGAAFARSASGASTGLGGARERVALFGGRLQFISEPGTGTQLRVHLPMNGK